ncbi:hypothetical protein [Bartonella bacilliformis]|nr:hypothetical protein [Bartonella bacilliformis]
MRRFIMLFETLAFGVLWIVGGMALTVKITEWITGISSSSS